MSKYLEIEVSTAMRPLNPEGMSNAIQVANDIISDGQEKLTGGWVVDPSDRKLRKPRAVSLKADSGYRYIHFSRTSNNTGPENSEVNLALYGLRIQTDPMFKGGSSVGFQDLMAGIGDELYRQIHRRTLEGTPHRFDVVDVVDSQREKETPRKLFVLRQLAQETDPFSMHALGVVTDFVEREISIMSPKVYNIGIEKDIERLCTLQRSIPIASTAITDEVKISQITELLSENLFDETCDFTAGKPEYY
jgi:hypothetical protein